MNFHNPIFFSFSLEIFCTVMLLVQLHCLVWQVEMWINIAILDKFKDFFFFFDMGRNLKIETKKQKRKREKICLEYFS